jgi:hypothetical protein
MGRSLLIALLAAVFAVLQLGLGHLLPESFSLVSPVFALVLWLLMDARLKDALVAAVTAGVINDSVSSMPAGLVTLSLVATLLISAWLFAHVFTNQAMAAAFGLQAAAFVCYQFIWTIFRAVRFVVFGWSWGEAGVFYTWDKLVIGLLVQLFVMAALFWVARRLERLFSSALMVASRPSRS